MTLRIEIVALGETVVQRDLAAFGRNMVDLTDAMHDVGTILREAAEKQFVTEGGHASGGWPPLADSTNRDRVRQGFPPVHPIMRRTERLLRSLTVRGDSEHVEEASGDSLRFGTLVPYAVYHQSSAPRHKIPYRPLVALTETDKRRIIKAIQRKIVEGVTA